MICFLDKTFCMHECGNILCDRNYTKDIQLRFMMNSGDIPVSFADMKTDKCGFIQPIKTPGHPNE